MKIDYYSDKVVIYLIGKKIKLENSSIKELLTNIFDVLVNYYDFEINNNYNINIYINEVYGIIVELISEEIIKKEDTVHINLNVMNDKLFLYEIDDPLKYINSEIYYYDDKYYLNVKKMDINLLEYTTVIYDDTVYKILGRGVKI